MKMILATFFCLPILAQSTGSPVEIPQIGEVNFVPAGSSFTEAHARRWVDRPVWVGLRSDFAGHWTPWPSDASRSTPASPKVYKLLPCRIPGDIPYEKGRVSLLVLPDKALKAGSGNMVALLVNDTESVWSLIPKRDDLFTQEVRVGDKPWKPVECVGISPELCATPDSPIGLPPHTCWEFEIARYRGPTQGWFHLVSSNGKLVSNKFEGTFDARQFSMGYDLSKYVLGEGDGLPPDGSYVWPKFISCPEVTPPAEPGVWKMHDNEGTDTPNEWSADLVDAPVTPRISALSFAGKIDSAGHPIEMGASISRSYFPRPWVDAAVNAMRHAAFVPATVEGTRVASMTGPPLPPFVAISYSSDGIQRSRSTSTPGVSLRLAYASFLGPHPGFRGYKSSDHFYSFNKPEGLHLLRVLIGIDGKLGKVDWVCKGVSQTDPRLAAIRARASKLRFVPATINGHPLPFECLMVMGEEKPADEAAPD